jgi:hypothetical protein
MNQKPFYLNYCEITCGLQYDAKVLAQQLGSEAYENNQSTHVHIRKNTIIEG